MKVDVLKVRVDLYVFGPDNKVVIKDCFAIVNPLGVASVVLNFIYIEQE